MKRNENAADRKSALSTALAIASGFSFYILCMILPLVGPTGSRVDNAARNKSTFLMVLMATLALAGASMFFSLKRRKAVGTPFPRFSAGLCILCLCFLVIFLMNGFAI